MNTHRLGLFLRLVGACLESPRGGCGGRMAVFALVVGALGLSPAGLEGQRPLRGNIAAMREQYNQAKAHDYTFLQTRSQVERMEQLGLLVPFEGDANYRLDDEVSYDVGRPELRLFVERLSSQYRAACGEQLVVTSLTRPHNEQPRNASPHSVHPTGMAVDLRRSGSASCRHWLEGVLMDLEDKELLEATRERWPPHYHVAVYSKPYAGYVDRLKSRSAASEEAAPEEAPRRHYVRAGDSLWDIARVYGTTVKELLAVNGIPDHRRNLIQRGQWLELPGPG